MLGLFLGILLVSGGFYLMTRKQILAIKREKAMSRPPLEELIPSSLDLPEQWLAIRSGNVAAVQETLGLSIPAAALGKMALPSREWNGSLSPRRSKAGSLSLALPCPRRKRMWIFVSISSATSANALSMRTVLSLNSALSHHCWVRAHTGRIERAYAWCGETLWNQGKATPRNRCSA